MAIFSKLALAAASLAAVAAAPWDSSSKYSTHRTRMISRDFYVESYHPENIYKTYGDGIETPLKKRGLPGSIEDSGSSFIENELGIGAGSFKVRPLHPPTLVDMFTSNRSWCVETALYFKTCLF